MTIEQITAYLHEGPGAMVGLLDRLAGRGIDIRALSVAESRERLVIRMIVSEHREAMEALATAGVQVSEVPVLVVEVPDNPGGLARVMELLAQREVLPRYVYAFFTRPGERAWVILRVEDPDFAASILTKEGIRLVEREDLDSAA